MGHSVLVVGGTGLSGAAAVSAFCREGDDVWATGRYRSPRTIPEHEGKDIHWLLADVNDMSSLILALKASQPQEILYLAATVSIPYAISVPTSTVQTNVVGWVNMLEAIRAVGSEARIVLVGSGDQYGRTANDRSPLTEEAPFRPASAYAASKCAQDLLAAQYADQWDLPIIRARTFYIAGPGQVESYACASFAAQVARVEAGLQDSVRHGDLTARRDYVDIRDAAEAYRALLRHGLAGEAYNVCSGSAISMQHVLDTLVGLAQCPITLTPDPARMRPSIIPEILGSREKITALTGWSPQRPFEQTLSDMLESARRDVEK